MTCTSAGYTDTYKFFNSDLADNTKQCPSEVSTKPQRRHISEAAMLRRDSRMRRLDKDRLYGAEPLSNFTNTSLGTPVKDQERMS